MRWPPSRRRRAWSCACTPRISPSSISTRRCWPRCWARARSGAARRRRPVMAALALERLTRDALLAPRGKVVKVLGLVIEATGPAGAVGDLCQLRVSRGEGEVLAEIVGFRDDRLLLMPLGEMDGVAPGAEVTPLGCPLTAPAGTSLLGRVLDGVG